MLLLIEWPHWMKTHVKHSDFMTHQAGGDHLHLRPLGENKNKKKKKQVYLPSGIQAPIQFCLSAVYIILN